MAPLWVLSTLLGDPLRSLAPLCSTAGKVPTSFCGMRLLQGVGGLNPDCRHWALAEQVTGRGWQLCSFWEGTEVLALGLSPRGSLFRQLHGLGGALSGQGGTFIFS